MLACHLSIFCDRERIKRRRSARRPARPTLTFNARLAVAYPRSDRTHQSRTENRSARSRFRVARRISILSNPARLRAMHRKDPEIAEPSMRPCYRGPLACLLLISPTPSASAQDNPPAAITSHAESSEVPAALTGKERLGRKWTDEQRLDNCKVPINKRGTKPRPSTCARSAPRS